MVKSKRRLIRLSILLIFTILLLGVGFFLAGIIQKRNQTKIENLYFEDLTNKKEIGRLEAIDKVEKNIYYKVSYPLVGDKEIDKDVEENVDKLIRYNLDKYGKEGEVNYYYFIDYEAYIGVNYILSIVMNENFVSKDLKMIEDKTYVYLYDLNNGENLSKEDIFNGDYKDKIQEYLEDDKLDEDFNFVIKNDQLILIDYNISIPLLEIKDYLKIDLSGKNDYSNDNVEPVYTLINKQYQITEDTLLYENASMKSNVSTDIKKDTVVNVYSQSDKGWSVLLYDNKVLYIETKYLKEVKVETVDESSMVYAITDVNIRKEASTSSELLGVLKSGEGIKKLGEDGTWTKVLYNNEEAYIATSCLSPVKIKKREVKLNVPPQGNIDPNKPMVALSFDDGPNPVSTPMILDTLEKYNVRATFFDLGNLMKKYPDVVRREAQLGEVGTHSYAHKNLNNLSVQELNEDLRLSREAFKSVLGYEPILIRPPYGNANATVRALVDMPIINWDIDTLDWKYRNKDLILNEIDKYGNLDGRIILMHSIYKTTAEAVEILIPDLLDRGYQVVSISELATYKGYTLQTGTVYNNFK